MEFLVGNLCVKEGEIDLIMDDDGTFVFVEVKTRGSSQYGTPEESVTRAKWDRIFLAALHYLEKK
jgi:putative endonuclease